MSYCTRMNAKRKTTWVDEKLLTRLQLKAVKERGTLGEHVDRAIREYLKRK